MKISLLLLCYLAYLTAFGQTLSEKTITIDPYLSFQNYEHFKRLTLSSPDSPIEFLENFNFEWGYSYQLRVIEIQLEEKYSDGTAYEFAFQSMVSKNKMPDSTAFPLFIDPLRYYFIEESMEEEDNNTLRQINDSTYSYFNKVELIIPRHLESQMEQILESKQGKRGTFQFVDAKRIRLVGFTHP